MVSISELGASEGDGGSSTVKGATMADIAAIGGLDATGTITLTNLDGDYPQAFEVSFDPDYLQAVDPDSGTATFAIAPGEASEKEFDVERSAEAPTDGAPVGVVVTATFSDGSMVQKTVSLSVATLFSGLKAWLHDWRMDVLDGADLKGYGTSPANATLSTVTGPQATMQPGAEGECVLTAATSHLVATVPKAALALSAGNPKCVVHVCEPTTNGVYLFMGGYSLNESFKWVFASGDGPYSLSRGFSLNDNHSSRDGGASREMKQSTGGTQIIALSWDGVGTITVYWWSSAWGDANYSYGSFADPAESEPAGDVTYYSAGWGSQSIEQKVFFHGFAGEAFAGADMDNLLSTAGA